MTPRPAAAPSIAASAVLTERRERTGARISRFDFGSRKIQCCDGRKLVEGHRGQRGEILRPFRDAVRGEIGGTAAHHAAHRADPGRDQSAVGERADAQSDVDMIVDEVKIAVGKHKPDVDLGPLA